MLPTLPFTSVSSKNPPLTAGGRQGHPNLLCRQSVQEGIVKLDYSTNLGQHVRLYSVKLTSSIIGLQDSLILHQVSPYIISRMKTYFSATMPLSVQKAINNPTYSRIVHIGLSNASVGPSKTLTTGQGSILRVRPVIPLVCWCRKDYLTFYKNRPLLYGSSKEVKP